jgi:hypothetical protein
MIIEHYGKDEIKIPLHLLQYKGIFIKGYCHLPSAIFEFLKELKEFLIKLDFSFFII